MSAKLAAALAADDLDLARHLEAVAEEHGIAVPADQADALIAREQDGMRSAQLRAGGADRHSVGTAGSAGIIVGDLIIYRDLRDPLQEGSEVASGLEPDLVTVTLAAAGLALTGATVASWEG